MRKHCNDSVKALETIFKQSIILLRWFLKHYHHKITVTSMRCTLTIKFCWFLVRHTSCIIIFHGAYADKFIMSLFTKKKKRSNYNVFCSCHIFFSFLFFFPTMLIVTVVIIFVTHKTNIDQYMSIGLVFEQLMQQK